ncbi:fungal-specific transcription factor domain-containing protein [Penicillium angulare]|uniref:Fungal-specific transcription factor domain-containing protein n=1 Tax=Penicillium angulare TaxID=116970 RepID=A0A9W9FZG4_9EURO|nr:fungal-specific transcription factor domain-containing protein [Penicillium angulare]
MNRIEHLISFAEGVTSLGNISLQNQIFTINIFDDVWAEDADGLNMLRLVELLAQTQQACSELLPSQEDLPWEKDTVWRSIERCLERYPMRHPDKFCFDFETLDRLIQDEAIEQIVSVMIWHTCVLQLNRPLLRTPVWNHMNNSSMPQNNDMSARNLFLQERHRICQSSASAICVLAQELVDNDHFFAYSSLVGYACFQAGLVLACQTHHHEEVENQELSENLDMVFEILISLQNFYFSASQWLDVLFKVQDSKAYILHDVGSESKFIIRPHFDRFHDIEEAKFMCLTPPAGETSVMTVPNHSPRETALSTNTWLGYIGEGVVPEALAENNGSIFSHPHQLDDLYCNAEGLHTAIDATHEEFLFLDS